MPFSWKLLCRKKRYKDSGNTTELERRRTSTAFWSSLYNRTVRTQSYDEFMLQLGVLHDGPSHDQRTEEMGMIAADIQLDELLQPDQKTVERILLASSAKVGKPEIMKIAVAYFDSNWQAARLCGNLFHSIQKACDQCRQIETMLVTLSSMPIRPPAYAQYTPLAKSLCEIAQGKNPFLDSTVTRMFASVEEAFRTLSQEADSRSTVLGLEEIRELQEEWVGLCSSALFRVSVAARQALAGILPRTDQTRERLERSKKLQGTRLMEAVAKGIFTVSRMLDTLRCLTEGLGEDMESTRRLAEFGWAHREDGVCVQQVACHLQQSHHRSSLAHQLDVLQEQATLCLLIINKARHQVLQQIDFSLPPQYN